MARQNTSKTEDTTSKQQDKPQGTGQEPSALGVHVPGSAPGQYTDLGPVTIPADAPRQEQH